MIPQLADAARGAGARSTCPTDVALSVLIPNERGPGARARAARPLPRGQRLPVARRETPQPPERQPLGRGVARRGCERVLAPRARGGAALRGRDLDVVRLPLRGPRRRPSGCSRSPRGCADAGAQEIGFGDTTGMANPRAGARVLHGRARARWAPSVELTAHFHNTRGQGLANVLAALDAGVRRSFESSFGELGGCPVPPGATGNIATEDLVSMLAGDGRSRPASTCRRCSPARARGARRARPAARQPHARRPGRSTGTATGRPGPAAPDGRGRAADGAIGRRTARSGGPDGERGAMAPPARPTRPTWSRPSAPAPSPVAAALAEARLQHGDRARAIRDAVADVLAEGAIEVGFQPVVALASGDVVGYEALARGPRGTPLERPGPPVRRRPRAGAWTSSTGCASGWRCGPPWTPGCGPGRPSSSTSSRTRQGSCRSSCGPCTRRPPPG